ncbi:hypothetical protein FF2_037850 [Malus domestica]
MMNAAAVKIIKTISLNIQCSNYVPNANTNFNEIDQQKRDDDSSSVVVANDPAFEKKGYGDVMPQLVY